MNVLMYAFHPILRGYIGGGWFRTIEILKRGKRQGINYTVIENKPSFKDVYNFLDYESHEIDIIGIPEERIPRDLAVIKAIKAGVKLTKKLDFDIIVSPVERHDSVLPAYLASKITRVPWTVVLHSAPIYWCFPGEKPKHCTSEFSDIYRWFRYEWELSLTHSVVSTSVSWLVVKALESSLMLAVNRSIIEDLYVINPRVKALVIDPSWAVDFERIPEIDFPKEYDAISALAYAREKDTLDLVKFWSIVTEEEPKARLAIIGRTTGEIQRKLEVEIRKLGLENKVLLVCDLQKGVTQEELWAHMKRSCIYICSSGAGGGGLTVAEALACGLPVIAYDVPAVRYAHGECPAVVLVPYRNVEKLAKRALELLKDYSLLKRKSLEATIYAREYYNWDRVVKAEKEAYLKILNLAKKF